MGVTTAGGVPRSRRARLAGGAAPARVPWLALPLCVRVGRAAGRLLLLPSALLLLQARWAAWLAAATLVCAEAGLPLAGALLEPPLPLPPLRSPERARSANSASSSSSSGLH